MPQRLKLTRPAHASREARETSCEAQESSAPCEVLSDEAVVGRVRKGDLAAYELIMRRYNQRLFRVVRSIVVDEDEANDIVQEAYVRAYEHLEQFAGRAKFSTWLTKIAVHEAIARRNRRRRLRIVDPSDPQRFPEATCGRRQEGIERVSAKELSSVLADAIDALPDELRVVFMMRIIEELSTAETADCLSLSQSNVKIRLHRARARLRAHIDRQIGREARQLYQFDGQRCDRIVHRVFARLSVSKRPPAD
ncbi:MAG: RNA polymerase sigma factor [Novipirellula sp. JB048]